MRRNQIKKGEVYAVSDQRDATIGSSFWSFYPARVLEKNVERDENIHGEPTQRTDGVRVEVLHVDTLEPTGDEKIVRTREVKGSWEEHKTLLKEHEEKALLEQERAAAERAEAQDEAQMLTSGVLAQEQIIQVTPDILERAQETEAVPVGPGLYKVSGVRQDSLVLVLDKETWTRLVETQHEKGSYALRVLRVQVVQGPNDVLPVLAAALTDASLRSAVEAPHHEEHRGWFSRILDPREEREAAV